MTTSAALAGAAGDIANSDNLIRPAFSSAMVKTGIWVVAVSAWAMLLACWTARPKSADAVAQAEASLAKGWVSEPNSHALRAMVYGLLPASRKSRPCASMSFRP